MFNLFICKYDSHEEITLEILMKNEKGKEEAMNKIYQNENYKKAIKLWFPFLKKKGLLETSP